MHAFKGACMYIHPPHTYNINPQIYTQKYLNFGLWPKRPPLAFFMAEMSVAEMSWPKRPWPKCPWPKYPTFPRTPLTRRGKVPLSCSSPTWAFGPRGACAYGIKWPYHFSKTDDGSVLLASN